MSLLADILDALDIPYPDADVDRCRQAADFWDQLGDAAQDALAVAGAQANALAISNRGAAMDAFDSYWDKFGKGNKAALPALIEGCRAMAKACRDYADKVEQLRHTIDETIAGAGVGIVGGGLLTVFSDGISDQVGGRVANAIIDTCLEDIDAFGVGVAELAAEITNGAFSGAVTALVSDAASGTVGTLLHDKNAPGVSLSDFVSSALLGGLGNAGSIIAGAGIGRAAQADIVWDHLPTIVDKSLPIVTHVLSATPEIMDSPAGQQILQDLEQVGEAKATGQLPPGASSVIGDILNARIEGALDAEPEAPKEEGH